MKVIDLLNKIAKGELQDKTRFKVYSSCNDKDDKAAICEYDKSYPGTIWCICGDGIKFNYKIDFMRILNYEVEIIGVETEEIEEKDYYTVLSVVEGKFEDNVDEEFRKINAKLNEVIRAVNKLNKQDTVKETNCMTD